MILFYNLQYYIIYFKKERTKPKELLLGDLVLGNVSVVDVGIFDPLGFKNRDAFGNDQNGWLCNNVEDDNVYANPLVALN